MPEKKYCFGLIGYPLEHSLSPQLHQAAISAMNIQGEYRLYPITPFPEGKQAMNELIGAFRAGRLDGLNVTVPHKENVISWLKELSPSAQTIGAVNTIGLENDTLYGENTDSPGFMAALTSFFGEHNQGIVPGNALILGAGGSARAVAYALLQANWQVMVAARRCEQAHDLVHDLKSVVCKIQTATDLNNLTAYTLDRAGLEEIRAEIQLIVNATPLGMWPKSEESPWPTDIALPGGAMVYDLVYNPPETPFMQAARESGLPASNGLGMLVEQAALSLERWTGLAVPRKPMWESVAEFISTRRE